MTYDGPSIFRHNDDRKESIFTFKKDPKKASKEMDKKYQLPKHTAVSKAIQENRTSAPYRSHTVPSSYFRYRKGNQSNRPDYTELKAELNKKDKDYLLFEAYLSDKAEDLYASLSAVAEVKKVDKSEESGTVHTNKGPLKPKDSFPARKRLSRSLAGIIEAEETNEKTKRNMNSLFSNSFDL